MSIYHDADMALDASLNGRVDQLPFLQAFVDATLDRIASIAGHDLSTAVAASATRKQAEKATRARGRNRR